jgi:hypothetical protein
MTGDRPLWLSVHNNAKSAGCLGTKCKANEQMTISNIFGEIKNEWRQFEMFDISDTYDGP